MNSLNKVFEETFGAGKDIVFFTPSQNALFKTFDGIEIVGYRALLEICQFIRGFKDGQITKISIVGYSLGGLIARFVIGKMFSEFQQMFKGIEPQIFITLATPHLGVQFYNPKSSKLKSVLQTFLRGLGSTILGKSGREMFITNSYNEILVKLTQDEYLENLSKFKWRVTFANVKNDRTVAFYTSFITDCDPFINTNNDLQYVFEEKIPGSNYSRTTPRIVDMDLLDPKLQRPKVASKDYSKWFKIVPLIALFVVFILPIMFCLNLCATIYSNFVTLRYRKMLEEGKIPPFVSNKLGLDDTLKEYATDVYGSIMNEEEEDTNDDGYVEDEEEHMSWKDFIDKYSNIWQDKQNFAKLPFDDNRRTMLNNLNQLKWIRVPIYIKSPNAHGGIVARRGLDEDAAATSVACIEFTAQLLQYLLNRCN